MRSVWSVGGEGNAWLDVKENRSDVDQELQDDRQDLQAGRKERRDRVSCYFICGPAWLGLVQPWNTTPIRVSDDSTGSFAGTNNDPALCPRPGLAWMTTDIQFVIMNIWPFYLVTAPQSNDHQEVTELNFNELQVWWNLQANKYCRLNTLRLAGGGSRYILELILTTGLHPSLQGEGTAGDCNSVLDSLANIKLTSAHYCGGWVVTWLTSAGLAWCGLVVCQDN